jgi:hypothetical protein
MLDTHKNAVTLETNYYDDQVSLLSFEEATHFPEANKTVSSDGVKVKLDFSTYHKKELKSSKSSESIKLEKQNTNSLYKYNIDNLKDTVDSNAEGKKFYKYIPNLNHTVK